MKSSKYSLYFFKFATFLDLYMLHDTETYVVKFNNLCVYVYAYFDIELIDYE